MEWRLAECGLLKQMLQDVPVVQGLTKVIIL
jgi:hypothetical protein